MRGQLRTVVGYLAEQGWLVDWKETTPEVGATELTREAIAQGAEVVIAAGGDGTINGVINGMVGHPEVRLGILPTGTANVWAKESGITNAPLLGPNLEAAGAVLVEGVSVMVDVGKAGDRYFMLMAGVGLDALVMREINLELKKQVGALAYAWTAIKEGLRYRGARVRITVDGKVIQRSAWMVSISNSKLYALVPLAMDASVTDGLLDVGIFAGRSWIHILRHTIGVILRRHTSDPEVEFLRGKEIHIQSRPHLPVQVDAEPNGQTPMTFTVIPAAIQLIVPHEMVGPLTEVPADAESSSME